jgi:hypothetical protein
MSTTEIKIQKYKKKQKSIRLQVVGVVILIHPVYLLRVDKDTQYEYINIKKKVKRF